MPGQTRPPGEARPALAEERLTEWKGFKLLGFQIQAIEAIRAGHNVLVSAPTGAGKTLVAEYAIADAVARGRRCVYTAPIKALSNQKFRDFRDDPEIDVGLMTGDVTIHPSAQVLIMTTEILRNSILENPRGLDDIDYVIFDEVHFMDDIERGSVWEESLIFAPAGIRFIALSATIANLDQLGAWMGEIRTHELCVVRSERRPVPLKHRLFHGQTGLFPLERIDAVRRHEPKSGRRGARERGSRGRGRDGRRGPRRDLQAERTQRRESIGNLFDQLQDDNLLPALVFSFSRKDCERLASQNQHRQLLARDERERMGVLQRELLEIFQLQEGELAGEIFQLATHGVGYHHAGMLPVHKEVVERMFTSGLMKLLFTTETFALGINMPARTVVFSSLRKFDGVSFDFLRTRDYMQMAGRAGRQGIDKEGLVISFLEAQSLEEAPLARILSGKSEPVESRFRLTYSTLLHLIEHLGRERLHEAWEKSFNQYQHRAKSKKAREGNRRAQARFVDAHLGVLAALGYVDEDDHLTPRGTVARHLHGYELQITELLFRGALENLPPRALAVIFVGLVHEERRRGVQPYVPPRIFGGVRRHVDQVLARVASEEARFAIPTPLKLCDWGLSATVDAWCAGASFDELAEHTDATAGDICRTFRMALQLVRHVRRSLDPKDDLPDRLAEVIEAMNREEVDARRQLELG